jgi:hypothetical protein
VFPHRLFRLGNLQNSAVTGFWFNALDYVDHAGEGRFPNRRKKTGMTQHGFFHQRIARTDGDTVAARYTARFTNGRATVPQYTRVWIFPINGKRFIHLDVLAGLNAAATQDALIRIVPVERIGVINLIRLRSKRDTLMLNGK